MTGDGATTDLDDLLDALTLEEKVSLTAGADNWHTPAVERLGIPALRMSDGPVGVRGTRPAGGPPSACFPCGSALAATWDVGLVEEVGTALGHEAKAKAAHLVLAPTVNMHRSPLAGRNFECFSEDPHLAGRMAVAYITGVQSTGVGACIKHLVANDSEFERFTMSSEVPERALREIYLRPFEVAVAEATPIAVMAAYNKLGGTWCSEHRWLLTTVLRDEWGFDGLVVSDWWATHTTRDAIDAGLDVEMPGPPRHRGPALLDAVERGEVDATTVDRAARRVLAALAATGALDTPAGTATHEPERADDTGERRALARRAAAASVVVLRNDGMLPLDPAAVSRVAVVGPAADATAILGGGSAAVSPYYSVSFLEGLVPVLAAHGVEVVHEPGCSITKFPPPVDLRWTSSAAGDPGIDVTIVDGDDPNGTTVLDRHVTRRSSLAWGGPAHRGVWSARMTATLRPPVTGTFLFQGGSSGMFRILVSGEVVVDGWHAETGGRPRRLEGTCELHAGDEYELAVEFCSPPESRGAGGGGGFDLRCEPPLAADAFERAVAAAAAADATVVCVGTNADWETEGRDRTSMDLPGRQVELIEAIAAVNQRTVVVVNAGAPVAMGWSANVAAVAQAWFLGMEAGNGVADVLTGAVDAAGRLPTTIPRSLEDTPAFVNYPGEFGRVLYGEGIHVGYRWYDARKIEPQFAFGHGLSYTEFAYGEPSATVDGQSVEISVPLANAGSRHGVETVQVYVHAIASRVARAPKQLAGFTKVALDPGESCDVKLVLDLAAFAYWHPGEGAWRVDPGEFELLVGASAADIRSRVRVAISA